MAETPTPGAAAELPVVGYAIRESDQFVWADTRKDRPFAKAWRAVVYADDAQSQLDALREEVARLTKERDALVAALTEFVAAMDEKRAANEAMDQTAATAERSFAATDRLWANLEPAREALRAKLAARKEQA